jgi:hypothetical protein
MNANFLRQLQQDWTMPRGFELRKFIGDRWLRDQDGEHNLSLYGHYANIAFEHNCWLLTIFEEVEDCLGAIEMQYDFSALYIVKLYATEWLIERLTAYQRVEIVKEAYGQ